MAAKVAILTLLAQPGNPGHIYFFYKNDNINALLHYRLDCLG